MQKAYNDCRPPPRCQSAVWSQHDRVDRPIQRLAPLTASQRVRERLRSAGTRFHANDNIADYLEDGELEAIEGEVAAKAQEMLRALVIDVDNDHNTRDTGRRLAKMFLRELFAGRYQHAPAVTASAGLRTDLGGKLHLVAGGMIDGHVSGSPSSKA